MTHTFATCDRPWWKRPMPAHGMGMIGLLTSPKSSLFARERSAPGSATQEATAGKE
jgi:hypothetical protein